MRNCTTTGKAKLGIHPVMAPVGAAERVETTHILPCLPFRIKTAPIRGISFPMALAWDHPTPWQGHTLTLRLRISARRIMTLCFLWTTKLAYGAAIRCSSSRWMRMPARARC